MPPVFTAGLACACLAIGAHLDPSLAHLATLAGGGDMHSEAHAALEATTTYQAPEAVRLGLGEVSFCLAAVPLALALTLALALALALALTLSR